MEILDTKSILEYLGIGAGGLLGTMFFGQKLVTIFKGERAESNILSLMHNELERMSEQNTNLSIELGKLQSEILTLNKQLRLLTAENERLNSEVSILTAEVSRLQNILHSAK